MPPMKLEEERLSHGLEEVWDQAGNITAVSCMAENDMFLQIYSYPCMLFQKGLGGKRARPWLPTYLQNPRGFLEFICKGPAANSIVGRGHL